MLKGIGNQWASKISSRVFVITQHVSSDEHGGIRTENICHAGMLFFYPCTMQTKFHDRYTMFDSSCTLCHVSSFRSSFERKDGLYTTTCYE